MRLYSDELAELLVQLEDCQVSPASPTLVQVPEVAELCQEWTGYVLDGPIPDVRQDVVEDRERQQRPRREEE